MPHRLIIALLAAVMVALVSAPLASAHWPVASRYSRVTQWYVRSGHHNAVDIAAPRGTPVLAATAGRVIFAGWKRNGGGWQVWLQTPLAGRDLFTMYAHMRDRPLVRSGQFVAIGQRIGRVGSTGYTTGPHLHIEMWRGYFYRSGSYHTNPWPWIDHGPWLPWAYR
jgi:murein DD-endopeptidase MepM/ murein hydrolase activator NlpD